MAKQTFTSGQVLTAAQVNALQANDYNQTVSTKTGSYTLVAADAGTKIVMDSASATTITVNTSLFAAGDTLTILNIGAGVCTITAGTATVSSTGSLALTQFGGGTLYFTSAGVSVFQANGVAASAGGLVFITSGSMTLGSQLSFDNCFSATYANYLVKLTHTAGNNPQIRLRAGGADITASNYDYQGIQVLSSSATGQGAASQTAWVVGNGTGYGNPSFNLGNPFASTNTSLSANDYGRTDSNILQIFVGRYNATTSADGFSVIGTSMTVTARVYGYVNS
jgi:hypothetical protein